VVDRDGTTEFFHANLQEKRVTYRVSEADEARIEFIESGCLSNSIDIRYRAISDRIPVFAFAHHVGNVSKHNSSQE
jgi:hypothetical protein